MSMSADVAAMALADRLAKACYEVTGSTQFPAPTWRMIAERVLANADPGIPIIRTTDATDEFVKP